MGWGETASARVKVILQKVWKTFPEIDQANCPPLAAGLTWSGALGRKWVRQDAQQVAKCVTNVEWDPTVGVGEKPQIWSWGAQWQWGIP